jgi:hypothetical protein
MRRHYFALRTTLNTLTIFQPAQGPQNWQAVNPPISQEIILERRSE